MIRAIQFTSLTLLSAALATAAIAWRLAVYSNLPF